jgi:Caspase domain
MFGRTLLKLTVSAMILLAASSAFAENRVALVIGQSAYRSVPALPNPANDAKAVTQMLTDSGFEVSMATDLSQNELRQQVSAFAGKIAAKGADTVALVFYAGHGLQIDGENYLVPVDVDPKREADIPIQAVRLNDILNTLTSVPSKMRILMLDACRNNPFSDISKTSGGGLAIVDAKIGAPGTFLSFSTSPGAVAEDGSGADSPYTTALLTVGKEQGIPIEETFKRVRLAVNKATDGRQTPWDSSSLTDDFRFLGPAVAGPKLAAVKKTVAEWTRDLKGKPVQEANAVIVADGSDESYEAFTGLYAQTPLGLLARDWLDRHRRMVAWNNAVIINTAAGYRAFLVKFPDSDLTATARKLELRLRNRPDLAPVVVGTNATAQNAALTCPCSNQPAQQPQLKKVDVPAKLVDPDPPKRAGNKPPRRVYQPDEDVVVDRRPPPAVVYERAPPVGVGIGIGIGGYGGGNYGGRGRGGY